MKIGIDLTPLQGPHRMRGIGYTLISFINNLPPEAKKEHEFVFYLNEVGKEEALELLDFSGIEYRIELFKARKEVRRSLTVKQRLKNIAKRLPASVRAPFRTLKDYYSIYEHYYTGDKRIEALKDIDHFIQFDQSQILPRSAKKKAALVAYDLIPYVMESDYLWSYATARSKGYKRRSALNLHAKRHQYKKRIQLNCRRADFILAISEHTKKDFVRYLGISEDKISVTPLGVDPRMAKSQQKDTDIAMERYIQTSWGYLPKKTNLKNKKYLLFVGGADHRRKLVELVAAFNNLKAHGHDVSLVLAGDTMKGAFTIPNEELQDYFANTSYLDDIHFLGFVSDEQREWLYQNALAFVYPSVYEGFGLPILEAMQYGTPVITYANSSILEVAGNAALVADDYKGIYSHALSLIVDKDLRDSYAKKGSQQVKKFSWEKTSKLVLSTIAK